MSAVRNVATLASEVDLLLQSFGVDRTLYTEDSAGALRARSPINGEIVGSLRQHSVAELGEAIAAAQAAFLKWRHVPAPRRGEFVRLLGQELRDCKAQLGRLVSIEAGKVVAERLGEVQ
jgi:aldehyde dehydrogenase (NAD+)